MGDRITHRAMRGDEGCRGLIVSDFKHHIQRSEVGWIEVQFRDLIILLRGHPSDLLRELLRPMIAAYCGRDGLLRGGGHLRGAGVQTVLHICHDSADCVLRAGCDRGGRNVTMFTYRSDEFRVAFGWTFCLCLGGDYGCSTGFVGAYLWRVLHSGFAVI